MFIQRIPTAPAAPFRVAVWAPAKVNLYLEVLGKRPDGYHEIATLMMAIDLYDGLVLEANDAGTLSLVCDVPELPCGPDNLVLKAAALLKSRSGCPKGAAIRLTKRIPWSAGLGGGSSDAAAALAGLNDLWELGLSKPELAALGAEIGSDVPFFYHTPMAWCTGRGEIVTPVPLARPLDLVLVCPEAGLSTAAVYGEVQSAECRVQSAEDDLNSALCTLHSVLAEGDVEKIARCLHNRLEGPAMRLSPPVAEWLRRLRNTPAAGCLMSGSGSSLFALCRDGGEALRVADAIRTAAGNEFARTRVFLVRSCV